MYRSFLLFALLPILGATPGRAAPAPVADALRWTLSVEDETGAPLAARLQGTGPTGEALVPRGEPLRIAWTGHRYVYVEGATEFLVDPGRVRVNVSHGPEFEAVDRTYTLNRDDTRRIVLRRLFDPRSDGWYSGDGHVHIAHGGDGDVFDISPAALARITRAEDLAVTCVLSNGRHFVGAGAHPAGSPDHLVHFGMEYRSALFGHMGLLGLPSLLNQGCCLIDDPPYPTNASVARAAADLGATVVFSHPVPMDPAEFLDDRSAWPYSGFGREAPAVAVTAPLHGFDIMSYSNLGVEDAVKVWYDLLDLGLRVPATAGSDAGVNRDFDPPPGGFRMYARLPEGEPLTVEAWLEALRAGRTYVTNGPLLREFRLQGADIGGQLRIRREAWLVGSIAVDCREWVDHIDIVVNGEVLRRIPAPRAHSFRVPVTLFVPPTDGWVVARVYGTATNEATVGQKLLAISSPIYLLGEEPGVPGRDPAVERMTGWLRDLTTLVLGRQNQGDGDGLAELTAELERDRVHIAGQRAVPGEERENVASLLDAGSVARPLTVWRAGRGVRFSLAGEGEATLEVYSVDGRLRHTERVSLPAESAWDAPRPAGVYLVRLVPDVGTPYLQKILLTP